MRLLMMVALMVLTGLGSAQAVAEPVKKDETKIAITSLTAQIQRSMLVGTWYRSNENPDGSLSEELSVMNADGSYVFHFRFTSSDGRVRVMAETGLWGISGNIHFTIKQKELVGGKAVAVDPTDAGHYLAYEVTELTVDSFNYTSLETGVSFVLKRVSDDFTFPQII